MCVAPVTSPSSRCRHSLDFISVLWHDMPYEFSKTQAQCIRVLWEAWESGTPVLSEKTVGEAIESASNYFRLFQVFRKKQPGGGYQQHPAWGAMIRPGTYKGTFRLAPPASHNNPS